MTQTMLRLKKKIQIFTQKKIAEKQNHFQIGFKYRLSDSKMAAYTQVCIRRPVADGLYPQSDTRETKTEYLICTGQVIITFR